MLSFRRVVQLIAVWMLLAISALAQAEMVGAARDWYARQPWLVGSNYNPASAINQLEMWQATRSIQSGSISNLAGPRPA